ncbi:MAG: thioredoxin family protein [Granulosicoccus sp.]
MTLTQSGMLEPGSPANPFTLPDTRNGQAVSLDDFTGKPVLIAFICNHCPYVVHLLEAFTHAAHELAEKGVATIAISANDASQYPADSPANMGKLALEKGFEFPYCHDESQEVARAYSAVCTPDIYLFDAQHKLYYRGQFDDSRPGKGQADGADLMHAAAQLLDRQPPARESTQSVGCSIKWKR